MPLVQGYRRPEQSDILTAEVEIRSEPSLTSLKRKKVIVVGGGIAGLFCARELANHEDAFTVEVLEATNRFGGRIETIDLSPSPAGPSKPHKAEFGPMRFELEIQPLFKQLLEEFAVESAEFAAPQSPEPPVRYPLMEDERSRRGTDPSALELLRLGVYRMFNQETTIREKMVEGRRRAVVELSDPGKKWLASLSDQNGGFDRLRQDTKMPGTQQPLYEYGFWNALHTRLSPMAVLKILHFGTFYHLIPDNPNAVEWAIFWLRLFQLEDNKLSTIPDGVETVVDKMVIDLRDSPNVTLRKNQSVKGLRSTGNGTQVEVELGERGQQVTADHVVLAIPKEPLLRLADDFDTTIRRDLDSVIAFPLLKVFCVTKTPKWWKTDPPRPQEGAWIAPTRELHYFPVADPASCAPAPKHTLVLFYMDRPSTAYWQPYLTAPESHRRAEVAKNSELKKTISSQLVMLHLDWALKTSGMANGSYSLTEARGRQILKILTDLKNEVLSGVQRDGPEGKLLYQQRSFLGSEQAKIIFELDAIKKQQEKAISTYAIRDWSRPPFGAGCHAWAPDARSWEVRGRLAAFGFKDSRRVRNLHVCGEAYSDYQGFIEGALRSASDAAGAIIACP